MYMYLYVLNSFIETSMHRKKANEKYKVHKTIQVARSV